MKKLTNFKGFTLLELLIVVVILAILAGLALPQYLKTVARARESEGWTNMATLRSSQLRYYAEYSTYTGTIANLDVSISNTPLYTYAAGMVAPGTTFTATSTPTAKCNLCRTLTVDDAGGRSSF